MLLGDHTFLGDTTYPGDPVNAPADTGSWWGLLAILREPCPPAPLVACPNDGEPLTRGPRGELRCRFDGWRPAA